MPRYARIHVTGGLFHIIARFHDRRFYLDMEGAREKYLELLGKAMETHDGRIVAYCLMSSHVHLALQLGTDSIGKLTKKIHSPLANWINKHRHGIGVVMADRPKSVLVHTETYGAELIRYVHNNPVRAGIVDRAIDSGWSSHRAYLGLEQCPDWLATEAVLGPDASEHETIRHELACFVDKGRHEERRPEFSGEVSNKLARRIRKLMSGEIELSYPVLGPGDFVASAIEEQAKRHQGRQRIDPSKVDSTELVRAVFNEMKLDPMLARKRVRRSAIARGRALSAWIWVEMFGWPQVGVAQGIGVRPCTVSNMIAGIRREGLSRKEARLVNRVVNSLAGEKERESGRKQRTKTRKLQKEEPRILVLNRNRKK